MKTNRRPSKLKGKRGIFEAIARHITNFTGSTMAFMLAILAIILWIISGPYFGYSDTWQLVINTSTTIITFLMVFLIQRAQNKDSKAVHMKLNELVAALKGPSNRLIDIEDLSEADLEILANYYKTLAEMAKKTSSLSDSHSIEEAVGRHEKKYKDQQ